VELVVVASEEFFERLAVAMSPRGDEFRVRSIGIWQRRAWDAQRYREASTRNGNRTEPANVELDAATDRVIKILRRSAKRERWSQVRKVVSR